MSPKLNVCGARSLTASKSPGDGRMLKTGFARLVASAAWAVPSVGHEVHAVIVDHGLQADSARVAHKAGDIVRQWGIDNVARTCAGRYPGGTGGGGPTARRLRSRTLRRSAALTRYFLPTPEKIKLRPSSCDWHADQGPVHCVHDAM